MFCPKCGTKLNDDAIFCQHCGAKLNALINTSFSNKPRLYNDELNRDALKIYLGDILSLECIKNKLRIKYNKINKEIASVQDYQKYKMDHSYNLWVHLFYKDGIEYIAMKKYVDRVAVWDWLPPDYEWMSIDNNMNFLKSTEAWGDVACSSNFITAHFEKKSAINDFLHIYKDFKKCAPLAHQENLKKINLLTKKRMVLRVNLMKLTTCYKKHIKLILSLELLGIIYMPSIIFMILLEHLENHFLQHSYTLI